MTKPNFEVYVRSDLYRAGLTEDGEEFNAEEFYVVVEFENGQRFAHSAVFKGCKVEYDDEHGMTYFIDVRKDATAEAERLASRVRTANTFNRQYWREISAAYGSQAYQSGGWEQKQISFEREMSD